MDNMKDLLKILHTLRERAGEIPSGSKKPLRGFDALANFTGDFENSKLIQDFMNLLEGMKNDSPEEAQRVLEAARKRDDQALKSLQVGKQEIHHRTGHAEIRRSERGLTIQDQVDNRQRIKDTGRSMGSTQGNLEQSGLGFGAHRGRDSEFNAHFGLGGRLTPDTGGPITNHLDWWSAYTDRIEPQAITGSSLGIIADQPYKEALAMAIQQGGGSDEAAASVFLKQLNEGTNTVTPVIREARKGLKAGGVPDLDYTPPTEANVENIFNKVGGEGRALIEQIRRAPQGITRSLFDSATDITKIPGRVQELMIEASNHAEIRRLAPLLKNPQAARALGLAPFVGTGIGALTVESNQAARAQEIKENPNDPTLKINKHLDWWSGWGDRVTAAGAGLSATGVGAPIGVPMMAAGELTSTVTGLSSLAIDAGRAAVKATSEEKNKNPLLNIGVNSRL